MRRLKMRGWAAVLATGMLVFVIALTPTVAAKDAQPLRGEMTMSFDFAMCPATCHWQGTMTGDIEVSVQFWETAANFFPGKTEHFFETFTLTSAGGTASGLNVGLFNMGTFKFRSNAWVDQASGDLTYLLGHKIHFEGVTSQFPPPEGSSVVTATASWFVVQP